MEEQKVIFHIDELNKWNLLLKNVSNLVDIVDINKFHIEVLANSEAVKAYALSGESEVNLKDTMEKLKYKGIKFVVCNNALNAYNIKKEELLHFVDVVPAGVLELVIKQSEGYSYIKP